MRDSNGRCGERSWPATARCRPMRTPTAGAGAAVARAICRLSDPGQHICIRIQRNDAANSRGHMIGHRTWAQVINLPLHHHLPDLAPALLPGMVRARHAGVHA